MPENPALGRQRPEDHDSKISLGNTVSPSQTKEKETP
jgi:hypothetical protein